MFTSVEPNFYLTADVIISIANEMPRFWLKSPAEDAIHICQVRHVKICIFEATVSDQETSSISSRSWFSIVKDGTIRLFMVNPSQERH